MFKETRILKAAMEVMLKRMETLEARVRTLEARMDEQAAHTPDDNEEERFRKGYEAILSYDYQKALDFGGDA